MPDASFSASASVVVPHFRINPTFMRLMVHTCTIQKTAQVAASNQGSYGHQDRTFSTIAVSYANVQCRFRELSMRELEMTGRAGQIVASHMIYIPRHLCPDQLLAVGAAATHRIVDIIDRNGSLIDAGPFDVQSVTLAAGEAHHAVVLVQRIG